jgi:hypothetical protein
MHHPILSKPAALKWRQVSQMRLVKTGSFVDPHRSGATLGQVV